MKKWYEVYFEFWDKKDREWHLTATPIWKFATILGLVKLGYDEPTITDIKYVSPKMIEFID